MWAVAAMRAPKRRSSQRRQPWKGRGEGRKARRYTVPHSARRARLPKENAGFRYGSPSSRPASTSSGGVLASSRAIGDFNGPPSARRQGSAPCRLRLRAEPDGVVLPEAVVGHVERMGQAGAGGAVDVEFRQRHLDDEGRRVRVEGFEIVAMDVADVERNPLDEGPHPLPVEIEVVE